MALPYRILEVEDDDATRLRTAEVIQQHADLALAGVAMDCASALRAHGELAPDAILCDLGLPDGSGVDLIRAINAESAPPLIMVLSNFGDEVHVVEAIKAGACAYLLKGASPREIHQAILDMRAGGSPISAAVARHLLTQIRPAGASESAAPAPAESFTSRELEVLQLIAKGYTYQDIAGGLAVSINTVREHIRKIYRKLAVRSRGEAVFEAQGLGLIGEPADTPKA